MSETTGGRAGVERLLDVAVYAPFGLIVTVAELMPTLASRGRARLAPKVSLARTVGRLAVHQGARQVSGWGDRLGPRPTQDPSSSGFGGPRGSSSGGPAGSWPSQPAGGIRAPSSGRRPVAQDGPSVAQDGPSVAQDGGSALGFDRAAGGRSGGAAAYGGAAQEATGTAGGRPGASPSRRDQEERLARLAPPAKSGDSGTDPGALAIPSYDSLSAPQVVQRLAGLSRDEVEAVRAYEAATRGRRTILARSEQLLA